MCSFAEFTRSKLDICTNLQKKYCIGEQILLVLELLDNAHHIRNWILGICRICWTKIEHLHQFTEKALYWRANIFSGNGASM